MKIKDLKKIIENADDEKEVWVQASNGQWVDCVASIDDNGILAIHEQEY